MRTFLIFNLAIKHSISDILGNYNIVIKNLYVY